MPLTDTAARTAKPEAKARKLFDGGGLYLEVAPSGGKWWRLKYRYGGKERRVSLGTYPAVSLKEARLRREEARTMLRKGIEPSAARKAQKLAQAAQAADSFEAITREWMAQKAATWTSLYGKKVAVRLEANVFPWLGRRPIREVTALDLLAVLRRVEGRGAVDTAHRVQQYCSAVFRYAVATGRADADPSSALRGALKAVKVTHHPSIRGRGEVGGLLRAIDDYSGDALTRYALRLAPLVFVRPGELRAAEWAEIDWDAAEWRIAPERMKMRAPHIVPLSRQALAILRDLEPLTGRGRFLFPSMRSSQRCMSENTLNAALRRMGYSKEEMTAHGFRSMASTMLNEMGWNRDAIERQLAHAERDAVRAAYNYAEHLPERRRMMQAWADCLEALCNGGKVTPIRVNA